MTDASELRPPERSRSSEDAGLVKEIWASISTDEVAARVLVTACVTLAVGWLGIKEAIGAVVFTQVFGEAIKKIVERARLSKRRTWLVILVLFLFQLGQRAFAAVRHAFRLPPSRPPGQGVRASAATTAVATVLAVGVITLPELAVGHSLVDDRRTTLFDGEQAAGGLPVLTLPGAARAEATSAEGARVTYSATTPAGIIACTPASGSLFPIGTTRVDCSATAGGETASGSFAVTVADETPPKLTVPAGPKREVRGSGAPVAYTVSARDVVDGSVEPACVPASGSRFSLGETIVRCSAVDARGNEASATFRVVLTRVAPVAPTLRLPASLLREATGPDGAPVVFTASAADASGRPLAVSCLRASGSAFAIGTTSVSCTASAQGEQAAGSFDVTVRDTTPPALVLPGTIERQIEGDRGAIAFAVNATDVVSGAVEPSCTPASGSRFPIGETVVRCSATDAAGNRDEGSFLVRLTRRPPRAAAISVPSAITTEATGPAGAEVRFDVAATDQTGSPVDVRCSRTSGSIFALGRTTVTCTAQVPGAPVATESFEVTVQDTEKPDLVLPQLRRVEALARDGAPVTFVVTASDVVSGGLTPSCTRASGDRFAIGSTTVECTATDGAGNTARGSFDVEVFDAGPLLRVPLRVTVRYSLKTPRATPVTFRTLARDRVDGLLAVRCSPSSGSGFPVGETTVTCTATDSAQNVVTKSFAVEVVDRVPPRLILPNDITAWAQTFEDTLSVRFRAFGRDVIDGSVSATCDPPSRFAFPVGKTTTVTCTATDKAGNTATGTFTVTVNESEG